MCMCVREVPLRVAVAPTKLTSAHRIHKGTRQAIAGGRFGLLTFELVVIMAKRKDGRSADQLRLVVGRHTGAVVVCVVLIVVC